VLPSVFIAGLISVAVVLGGCSKSHEEKSPKLEPLEGKVLAFAMNEKGTFGLLKAFSDKPITYASGETAIPSWLVAAKITEVERKTLPYSELPEEYTSLPAQTDEAIASGALIYLRTSLQVMIQKDQPPRFLLDPKTHSDEVLSELVAVGAYAASVFDRARINSIEVRDGGGLGGSDEIANGDAAQLLCLVENKGLVCATVDGYLWKNSEHLWNKAKPYFDALEDEQADLRSLAFPDDHIDVRHSLVETYGAFSQIKYIIDAAPECLKIGVNKIEEVRTDSCREKMMSPATESFARDLADRVLKMKKRFLVS